MYGQLNHFDYAKLDQECNCSICVTWRTQHATYTGVLEKIEGHARSCRCDDCREKYKVRSAYLAAMNQRDLYCEASFHAAAESKELGVPFMEWLSRKIRDGRTMGWWEISAPNLPLAHWFMSYQRSTLNLAVSGA